MRRLGHGKGRGWSKVKGERARMRLREIHLLPDAEKAAIAGVSVTKWSVLVRAERRRLLWDAVSKEK